jgi:Zn-dependent protease
MSARIEYDGNIAAHAVCEDGSPALIAEVQGGFVMRLWLLFKWIGQRLWKPFPMCRIARVSVQFHSTALVFPAGYLLWMGWSDHGCRSLWQMGIVLAILWLSLLVHEFAHILAARSCGIGSRKIVFLPVGAVAMLDDIPPGKKELWIAIAGPLASLALAGVCQLGIWTMHYWMLGLPHRFVSLHHDWLYGVLKFLKLGAYLNTVLGLFNLLPCFPLDGGRILRSMLGMVLRKLTRRTSESSTLLATAITVRFVAWPLAFAAVIYTISTTHIWMHLILFPLAVVVGEI